MNDNIYINVIQDAPDSAPETEPDKWWRADIVIAGVFGADKVVVASGFGKRGKGETNQQAQGSAVAMAWHHLHQSTPIRRP